ncbi:hypothetical protein PSAC2689_150166 [Paraburkholderia sacchari]
MRFASMSPPYAWLRPSGSIVWPDRFRPGALSAQTQYMISNYKLQVL